MGPSEKIPSKTVLLATLKSFPLRLIAYNVCPVKIEYMNNLTYRCSISFDIDKKISSKQVTHLALDSAQRKPRSYLVDRAIRYT